MKLIKCDEKYLSSVQALYHRSLAFLNAHINYPKWTSEHPSDRGVSDAVRKGEQYICLDHDELLGALILSEDPEGYYEAGAWSAPLNRGEYLVIHALAVDPDFNRQGIGSFMVEECISVARRKGYRAIRLDIVPDNLPAARLYEKHGFVYVSTVDLRRNIEDIPVFSLYELNL